MWTNKDKVETSEKIKAGMAQYQEEEDKICGYQNCMYTKGHKGVHSWETQINPGEDAIPSSASIQAATLADTQASPAPAGKAWVEEPVGSGNYVLKSITEAVKASRRVFANKLLTTNEPVKPGFIEVGDNVFLNGLGITGTVVRVNAGVTYVETEKEKARPCWPIELTKRNA